MPSLQHFIAIWPSSMIAFKGIRMRNWTRINVIRARDEREIHRRPIEISKIEIDAISLTYYCLNGRFKRLIVRKE